jgi:hypothetical protein
MTKIPVETPRLYAGFKMNDDGGLRFHRMNGSIPPKDGDFVHRMCSMSANGNPLKRIEHALAIPN